MRYNFFRPIMLILIAYTAKTLTETIALMAGMPQPEAENLGFMMMIVAGIVTYIVFLKQRGKR